jgi:pimeloyl-ACP methyl ester carboxylesterase
VEQVEVGGLRIAFRRAGEGPPLVLLHGGVSDGREWRAQLAGLSGEFTVVAWDAPGCGGSSDPPESFRLPDYADCLAAFLGALEIERAHVAGLSFGAGLALEFYRRHPGLPRTLVLASAYAGWAGSLPLRVVAERLATALRESELPPERFVPGWVTGLLTDAAPAEMVDELVAIMSSFHPAGSRTMARAFAEADLRDVLPGVSIPTLLLYGDADTRSPPSVARELHAGIPESRLVMIPGAGHQCNVEAAERFTAEMAGFLRAQPG